MPPIMLAGLLAGTVPGFRRLSRLALYRLNVGEAVGRLWGAPSLVRDALGDFWRFRDRMPLMETLYALAPLLPAGIFSNQGILHYVVDTLSTAGLSADFRDVA